MTPFNTLGIFNFISSGDVVEYANGDKKIVLLGSPFGSILTSRDRNTYANLHDYNNYGVYNGDHQYDIVKLYRAKNKFRCISEDYENDYYVIWHTPEARRMTIAEICDELGYDVEIVG